MKLLLPILLLGFLLTTSCNEENATKTREFVRTHGVRWVSHTIGTSMLPTIRSGDFIVVARWPYVSLRRGLIVEYLTPFDGEFVCHRIVDGRPGWWVMRGDNTPYSEITRRIADRGYLREDNYLGVVVEIWHDGKIVFKQT